MMKGLQESAAEVTRVSREVLAEAKTTVAQAKEMFGENSAVARAARSVSSLSNNLPEVMAGLKIFNETFGAVYKRTFEPKAIPTNGNVAQPEDDSQFIPYDEGQAAQFEETNRMRKERLVLSDDELSTMRTDNYVEKRPAPQPPTPEP